MGEVWRATDTALGRPVAVKLLKSEYADDATFRSRFETEARHAASLHHPGVAAVYDVGESAGAPASPTARASRGRSWSWSWSTASRSRRCCAPGEPLDPAAVRDLLAQAADAIGAAHRAGIVHRDVKPANLLVTPDRQIKITDFGIARASRGARPDRHRPGDGHARSTSPPSRRAARSRRSASDVYSLGVVAFECLAGRRPFDAESPVATALAHLQRPGAGPARRRPRRPRRCRAPRPRQETRPSGTPTARLRRGAARPRHRGDRMIVPPTPAAAPRCTGPDTGPGAGRRSRTTPRRAVRRGTARSPVWPVLLVIAGAGDRRDRASSDRPDAAATTPTDDLDVLPSDTPSRATPRRRVDPADRERDAANRSSCDPDDYVGRDVDEVVADLRQLGLKVDTQPIDNPGDEEADTVESVSPDQRPRRGRHGHRQLLPSSRNRREEPSPSESERADPLGGPRPADRAPVPAGRARPPAKPPSPAPSTDPS